VIDFHAVVLQGQRCEQDLNAPQFVLLGFSPSRKCNQCHKNNHLVNSFGSASVFVFVVKEAFDLPCFLFSILLSEMSGILWPVVIVHFRFQQLKI